VTLETESLRTQYLGEALVEFLSMKTPRDIVESRPIRGGGSANFVAGHHFIDRLNQAFGFLWSSRIINAHRDGEFIIVQGEVSFTIPKRTRVVENSNGTKETITVEEIEVTKSQFGSAQVKRWAKNDPKGNYEKGDEMDIGNDYKAAGTDMLKKCAVSMGMFSDVYSSKGGDIGASQSQIDAVNMRGETLGWDGTKTNEWVMDQVGKPLEDCAPDEITQVLLPKIIGLINEKKAEEKV